jgi:integrase
MKLNDRTVTSNKPELAVDKTEVIIFDEDIPGFGLRLREGGSRAWIFQYSRDGHTRRMTLGKWPKLTAQAARHMVRPLIHQVGLGRDPAHEKQEARAHKETFGEAVAAYLKAKALALRPRTLGESKRYLSGYARGLHTRPLIAVTHAEIAELLAKLAEDRGAVTANRVRATIGALFNWAGKQGKAQMNPAAFTEKRAEQSRDRVLGGYELAAIWNAVPDGDFGAIIRLLMLSGQRRNEIGELRWSEIDLENGVISLPADRVKNGRPHLIPISKAMRAVLQSQPRMLGRDFVFGRGIGFSNWNAAKRALDKRLPDGMEPWTLHDLRRSVVTGMAELGIAPHIIESTVNHLSGHKGGIAGVYNKARYQEAMRVALDEWGRYVVRSAETDRSKAGCAA